MLCALRSRRLCERAPSRGTSAAPGGSTATSVTTPRPASALRSGCASARGRTPFRVTLPEHLNLKVLLDAARRLEKVVASVVPLKVSGGSTDTGLSPQACADGLADIHTLNDPALRHLSIARMNIALRHIAAFRQLEYLDVSDCGAANTLEPWVACRELQMLILTSRRSLEWLRGVTRGRRAQHYER
jgi:hypothetical protein